MHLSRRSSRSSRRSRQSIDSHLDRTPAAESSDQDHQITLVDRTSSDAKRKSKDPVAPPAPSDTDEPLSPQGPGISKRWTHGSIRQELKKRKYAKWQDPSRTSNSTLSDAEQQAESEGVAAGRPSADTEGSTHDNWGIGKTHSVVRRGRRRVRGILNAKKQEQDASTSIDAVIDVLYENQRGAFFFGIPLFSGKSLLNFDPSQWINGSFKPSPVNITNAQVPDPSWEWGWRSWYVDMSGDVDEEGWEYSFSFQKGFSWHGTHPWFHSFVRRRRWLRKRVRKGTSSHLRRGSDDKLRQAHEFTSEYFTIHSSGRPASLGSSIATSQKRTSSAFRTYAEDEHASEEEEIKDMATLMGRLRKATIDREKIVAVKRFVDTGGEELHYLAEYMPQIMSLLVFQNSRRQLLALLMRKFDAASEHREEHERRDQVEGEDEKRRINNLLNAVKAGDDQCKKLEYWSDVRDMVQEGETVGAASQGHGWGHEWQGVDTSGPSNGEESNPTQLVSAGDKEIELQAVDGRGKSVVRFDEPPSLEVEGLEKKKSNDNGAEALAGEEESKHNEERKMSDSGYDTAKQSQVMCREEEEGKGKGKGKLVEEGTND